MNKLIFNAKVSKETVKENFESYDLLSLTLNGVIKRDLNDPKGKFPASFETYKIVKKGDIILCLFDIEETPRTVGLSEYDGMITGAYDIVRCNKSINSKYVYYYFLNKDNYKSLKPYYKSLRNTISISEFLRIKLPAITLVEQEKIANFLDEKVAKIDEELKNLNDHIKILNTYKKSLFYEETMVATGTDPIPLKYIGEALIGLTYNPDNISNGNDGHKVLRANNIQDGKINENNLISVKNTRVNNKILLKENDLMICSRNGSKKLIGKNALITKSQEGYTFGAFNTVFRSEYNEFLYFLFNSNYFDKYISSFLTSTINQLTIKNLNNMKVSIPNNKVRNETIKKLRSLDDKINGYKIAINKKISLLEEYKKVLINDAITGKIKIGDEYVK